MEFHLIVLMVLGTASVVLSHGMMLNPPSRNSAWRFGFDNPTNYNDNEQFCGGFSRMMANGGKCGVCGDPWDEAMPRTHERGGRFSRAGITATYSSGQVVPVTINLSTNHMGYYEFRLCNNNNPSAPDSQRCMDKQVLHLADGSGTRFKVDSDLKGEHTVNVRLPRGLSCMACVMQWTYTAGNNWGWCGDGTGALGCGPQERFVNCADVRILSKAEIKRGNVNKNDYSNNPFIKGNDI
ncbi:unnamed protein product [Meganyctiphanes norvegica]|uniref:Chitin-binding type-4 domain-containing protein n=1 Tax=Meganyctiphanes norvegica TaxID=48144 RepID=A0AAV2SGB0_MEGNR